MFLIPEIVAITILNILFFVFASVAFVMSIKIVLKWNADATSLMQYRLEKQSYLVATIIKYIFYIKVPLFLFFIFVLDRLSFLIPGAMCGAGVINANGYGIGLILLKILNIYLFTYWIVLDSQDMKHESQPYIKQKFYTFIVLFFMLVFEIALESDFFYSLDIKSVVDCCGAIFNSSDSTYISQILNLSPTITVTLFYSNFLLIILLKYMKQKYFFSLFNILFTIIALITLISFFGTYIYEQPMHHCPFCMLQRDYHYIGYALYLFLFFGTFNGAILGFIEFKEDDMNKRYNISIIFNFMYLFIVTFYVLEFFFGNGVWL